MGNSDYIFKQGETLFYIGIFLAILLLTFTIYQLYRISKKDRNFFGRSDDDKVIARLPPAIGAGILGLLIIFTGHSVRNRYRRIRDFHAETTGLTIKRNGGGGNTAPSIDYTFIVNGKVKNGESGFTFDGEEIHGIKVPGGHYKVIYNRNNPDESVMDFKSDTIGTNN